MLKPFDQRFGNIRIGGITYYLRTEMDCTTSRNTSKLRLLPWCTEALSEEFSPNCRPRPANFLYSVPNTSSRIAQANLSACSSPRDDPGQLLGPPLGRSLASYTSSGSIPLLLDDSFSSWSPEKGFSYSLTPQDFPFPEQSYCQLQLNLAYHVASLERPICLANCVRTYDREGCTPRECFSSPPARQVPAPHTINPLSCLHGGDGFPHQKLQSRNEVHMDPEPENYYPKLQTGPSTCMTWTSASHPLRLSSCGNAFDLDSQTDSATERYLPYHLSTRHIVPQLAMANHEDIVHQHSEERIGDNIAFPSICFTCDNSVITYPDISAWRVHFWTEHPLINYWRPKKCLWEGCSLQKEFKSHRIWLEHAHNVHLKRFWCKFPGCSVGIPFGSKHMVDRHYSSTHAEPKRCPKLGCQAQKNVNLSRKDKLNEHAAKWHGPLECNVAGCARRRINGVDHGFSNEFDLQRHIRQKH